MDDLIKTLSNDIKNRLKREEHRLANDSGVLEATARDLARYLKMTITGSDEEKERSKRMLRHVKSRAKLLAASYEVRTRDLLADILDDVAVAAMSLLKVGLKGVL